MYLLKERADFLVTITLILISYSTAHSQVNVNSLTELKNAVLLSNQNIVLTPGNYNIITLPSNNRFFECSGSNNTINLTGAYINFPVGSSDAQHFLITGDNNTIIGGEFENTYSNNVTEITDFVSYNNNKSNLAYGADPHIKITGEANGTTINGTKITVRGSFPYGYGSLFGIGSGNTYGLDKRGGIEVRGPNTSILNCELQMRAFGHGIYIQEPANNTVIKNTLVEGAVRYTGDILAEGSNSLPGKNNYKDVDGNNIDSNSMISLCEDGIRVYSGGGSCTVENSTVKKMRGGIRLWLASNAKVTNSVAIDCGATNWNMPSNGEIINSSGNFNYAPISDFRLSRNNMDIEWTIIPSPNAIGSHNLADVLGSNHHIVFHRTDGPNDSEEKRAIVVTDNNSTIINETEYTIVLETSSSGNTIINCGGGKVIDNGILNKVVENTDCEISDTSSCNNNASSLQAECFDEMSGIEIEGNNIGFVHNGDWIAYHDIDLTSMDIIQARASSPTSGGNIEVRLDNTKGTLIGTIEVTNTGNWNNWETIKANTTGVSGTHDLYFVFTGGVGYLFNIDWLMFSSSGLNNSYINYNNEPFITPNLVNSTITIRDSANSILILYNSSGQQIFSKTILSDEEIIDIANLPAGIYFARNKKANSYKKLKLIKL